MSENLVMVKFLSLLSITFLYYFREHSERQMDALEFQDASVTPIMHKLGKTYSQMLL